MSTYITAIEIGSSKITGAVGKVEDDRSLKVLAIEEQPLAPGCVRYGCVINVEEVSSKLNIIKRLLENNKKVSPMKIKGAYIALGGRSMATHPAEATRTFPHETEVTEEIIADLQSQVRKDKSPNKEVLTSVPLNFTIDGKKITVPVGTLGYQIRARYNLVVCDEKNKKNIKTAFDKSGLHIMGGIARMLAVDSVVLGKDQRGLGSVIIDFGAETTTVAIYKDNALRFLSTIPMGSRLITGDLSSILNVSQERAEELKTSHVNLAMSSDDEGTSLDKTLDNIDYKLINNIVKARASEIIANINYQISQSHFKPEDLTEGVVLIGKGSRLNGFRDLLQKQTGLKIAYPTTTENISFAPDLSVPVADSLDVIAVLAAAAKNPNLRECLENQEPVIETNYEPQKDTSARQEQNDSKSKKNKGKNITSGLAKFFNNVLNSEDEFDEDE